MKLNNLHKVTENLDRKELMYDLLNSDVALQLHFPFCNIFNTLFLKNPTKPGIIFVLQ